MSGYLCHYFKNLNGATLSASAASRCRVHEYSNRLSQQYFLLPDDAAYVGSGTCHLNAGHTLGAPWTTHGRRCHSLQGQLRKPAVLLGRLIRQRKNNAAIPREVWCGEPGAGQRNTSIAVAVAPGLETAWLAGRTKKAPRWRGFECCYLSFLVTEVKASVHVVSRRVTGPAGTESKRESIGETVKATE